MPEDNRHSLIIIKLNALITEVGRAHDFLHDNEGIESQQVDDVNAWMDAIGNDLDNGNALEYEARMAEIQTILPPE
jgi:hypothetical protein